MKTNHLYPATTTFVLSVLLTILLVVLVFQYHFLLSSPNAFTCPTYTPSSPAPQLSLLKAASTTRTFSLQPALEDLSHAGDATWASTVLPAKGGFLWVRHNETYEESYGITMFHALHCLKLIRANLQELPYMQLFAAEQAKQMGEGEGRVLNNIHEDLEKRGLVHNNHLGDPDHVAHCVSYIAQSLACSGDSTIEPPWEERDGGGYIVKHGVDGEGTQHQCKDTSMLWKYAEQSERKAVAPWDWRRGDTVESIEGHLIDDAVAGDPVLTRRRSRENA
ncbi:hypothetical protein MMC18_004086 [Xylographa bjoerkii]|nr:hypothetical protein [Xylographa bjoerkii]